MVPPEDYVGLGVQDVHVLHHYPGGDAGGDLLAFLCPRPWGVGPPDAVEVVEGAAAPQERLLALHPHELRLPPRREVIPDVGLHVEPAGAPCADARPVYKAWVDRRVREGHLR